MSNKTVKTSRGLLETMGTTKEVESQARWVKATWVENKQNKCDAIPKRWVSRSRSTVWWPPTTLNYKKAIELCTPPPASYKGWSHFKLTWCSNTADSLADAQGIETAQDDADQSSSSEDADLQGPQEPSLGRGLRHKKKTHMLRDYESQSPATETETTKENSCVQKVVTGGVGDMTASLQALSAARDSLIASRREVNTGPDASIQAETRRNVQRVPVSGYDTPAESDKETPQPPGAAVDIRQVKTLLIKLSAACKLHHDEMLVKMEALEKKVDHFGRKLVKHRSVDGSLDKEVNISTDDEEEEQQMFCVSLPVHTFEDFHRLEEELEASQTKRKALKGLMRSLGGRDANDFVARCISSVIQRPQLAQYFNCGGHMKTGSILEEPREKENFMGTNTQKVLLHVLKKTYKAENLKSLTTRASDVLKRSSTMTGGDYYKKKKMIGKNCAAESKKKRNSDSEDMVSPSKRIKSTEHTISDGSSSDSEV